LLGCSQDSFQYPESRTVDHVDVYHGVEVKDPYRWLEDLDSDETKSWVEAQNRLTFGYLEDLPTREQLRARLEELWDYERFGTPRKWNERYFFSHNSGLQAQSAIFRLDTLDGEPIEVLDPNQLSEDGTVALTSYRISPDGRLMAYGLAEGGSDWQEWKVRDVDANEDLADHIKWVKFSAAEWAADSSGFFYSRYDQPNEAEKLAEANYGQKIYFHRVGEAQEMDRLIYERPDHVDWLLSGEVTDDGRNLVISVRAGSSSENAVFYKDLRNQEPQVVELLNQFDARYEFVGSRESKLWFKTDLEAPRGRVVEIDLEKPSRDQWRTLVSEANEALEAVSVLNNQFVCTYMRDAASQVRILSLEGEQVHELELPGLGSVEGLLGKPGDGETFYSFSSFARPSTIYHYDLEKNVSTVFRQPVLKFDPEDYETKQVFYSSKDSTRVPMFITYRKGTQRNGRNPTILYGYGGFNIARKPGFSLTNLVWMERGGIYSSANIRGGSEYGEEWHQAGMKLNKQNVFDDFIAAGEWLIEEKYTSTPYLAIEGGSNGGLLVGACLNQRPDLFGAAIPHVGVMDMLRFNQFTIGWAWVSDYGSPDNPEEFQALAAYSPYHNIRPDTEYPATLVTTADHDDRVVPAHSFKYAAALQKAQAGPAPILIRIGTRAGHGAGKPTSKLIDEAADKLAFLFEVLGE
ncbi:MAG TPA: prolyl oligopeptidase family serine peptidase, partial [Acidobacteriota bacterium]|nr:prolyl oligopeptidase family serine peptidase [Acidobacteriota bacterium]